MKIFSCVKQYCGFLLTLGAECLHNSTVMETIAERLSEPLAASEIGSGFMFLALHCDART